MKTASGVITIIPATDDRLPRPPGNSLILFQGYSRQKQEGEVSMLHAIHVNTAITNYKPATPVNREAKTLSAKEHTNAVITANPEVAAELTEKLNKLAKARPFSTRHRVKKYDPL